MRGRDSGNHSAVTAYIPACLLIANLRHFFRCESTLPWTYTTEAGSTAKDILDFR